jgi:ferredoxin-NADP reductase
MRLVPRMQCGPAGRIATAATGFKLPAGEPEAMPGRYLLLSPVRRVAPCAAARSRAPDKDGETMSATVRIKAAEYVTHNVRRFDVEKPSGFTFEPGQATEVSIDKDGWRDEKRPFTFTSLPEWDDLQFTIKLYPDHGGVTGQLGRLKVGDALILDEPWGTIQYKGPGTFIAGGAGVTPFIAILRALERDGKLAGHGLIFSNHTEKDIILREEFDAMDGLATTYVLSDEDNDTPGLVHGFVDRKFLAESISDFGQHFYVCGPDRMVKDISDALKALGAEPDALIFEK